MTTILTERLVIVTCSEDISNVRSHVAWLNHPQVVKYSEQRHKNHSVKSQFDYIDSIKLPSMFMEIFFNKTIIGTITAHVDKYNSLADIGILIGDMSAWGQGLGTEAWKAMMDHLIGHGIRKIEAGAMESNIGMIRIFTKTGMREEGRRPGHFFHDNKYTDLVQYGKLQ
jgi:ribosomal-protein-alanine N-acetyltransferase